MTSCKQHTYSKQTNQLLITLNAFAAALRTTSSVALSPISFNAFTSRSFVASGNAMSYALQRMLISNRSLTSPIYIASPSLPHLRQERSRLFRGSVLQTRLHERPIPHGTLLLLRKGFQNLPKPRLRQRANLQQPIPTSHSPRESTSCQAA